MQGGIAVPINNKQYIIAKHLTDVVVFDKIAGVDFNKTYKGLYGIEYKEKLESLPNKKYQDFVSETKNVKVASKQWENYKEQVKKIT